jgi:mannitol/fructose-specific phosphotransferase system IIA component (Ntr-type)
MRTKADAYWKLFRPSACHLSLKGTDKSQVFEEIVSNFIRAKVLSEEKRETALRVLNEREELASTGVGQNVAIPHVKLSGLEEAVFGLALHPEGVDWKSLDGEPVTILFTVLRPEGRSERHDPERHLEMMRWISNLGRLGDFRRFAMKCPTKKALVDLLKEMASA